MAKSGGCLNIKMLSNTCRNCHYKDETVLHLCCLFTVKWWHMGRFNIKMPPYQHSIIKIKIRRSNHCLIILMGIPVPEQSLYWNKVMVSHENSTATFLPILDPEHATIFQGKWGQYLASLSHQQQWCWLCQLPHWGQDGCHVSDNIFKCNFFNENYCIEILLFNSIEFNLKISFIDSAKQPMI